MTRQTLLLAPVLLSASWSALAQEAPIPAPPAPVQAAEPQKDPALRVPPAPPSPTAETGVQNPAQEGMSPMADTTGRPFHLVREGEDLFRIAYRYGLNLQQLVALNNIKNNTIFVGDKLWLAPLGAKVSLPNAPAKAGTPVPQEAPAAPQEAEDGEDFVARTPVSPATSPMSATVIAQPRVPHGTMPRPVPASQRTVVGNLASGLALPAESRFLRQALPAQEPEIIPLVDAVKVLPMLAKEEPRSEWSPRQNSYAQFWEKQFVHSAGIPSMAKWDGQNLWLSLRPALNAAPVRVVIPGAYLPAEIDTAVLQRLVRSGAVFEFLGHPMYLDGSEPVESILKGRLLAPWGFVARTVRVRVPAGENMVLTL